MTLTEFIKKWSRYTGKETSAYIEHFNDLCGLLQQKTPVEADPSGNDFFCFQKRVIKDLELLGLDGADEDEAEQGFADVWKADHFAWEYKGKKMNLDSAYQQLQRYRESLLNPPLLVVCDFDRYIIRTNFNGTVPDTHSFTSAQLAEPKFFRLLRNVFTDPGALKPSRTTNEVTEGLASQIAKVALSLQDRESIALEDAQSGRERRVAQKKNLHIARFLNRIIFCFFAEDVGLLPKGLFTEVAKLGLDDPRFFAERLGELFRAMATGASFGTHKIRHFNGHLFEDATVFELTGAELQELGQASEADWQFIQPSIMGTLFERALDVEQRSQLGAHYTSEDDIKTLVEPVLMAPFRREWAELRGQLLTPDFGGTKAKSKAVTARRAALTTFLAKLSAVTVLDPACGSGNFLYVALQLLLGLEKDVIAFATQLGFRFAPEVGVQQLKALEINPYAFELAQVSVQIGWLQWMRDNGFPLERTPVLQTLDGFQNKDALLNQTFRRQLKTLREAQEAEHEDDTSQKIYTERAWPDADIIVGNPPFLGGSRILNELGKEYQTGLFENYSGRVPGAADLCCYWFEKAREQIKRGRSRRAGLLATQGIRGGVNREVLKQIKDSGDMFFAISDRDWILNGANVHISMVGFDNGSESSRSLNGKVVEKININLTSEVDVTQATPLTDNLGVCLIGTKKAGEFELEEELATSWLHLPNPHARPNSDVLRPWVNGNALVSARRRLWIIDAGTEMSRSQMAGYEKPFVRVLEKVKKERDKNKEERTKENFWIHKRPGPELREALSRLGKCLAVVRHSKHLIFSWLDTSVLPDDGIYVFASEDSYFAGVLQSRMHRVWAFAQGTQVREKESGARYTPTTCFETFPFPFPLREPLGPPVEIDPLKSTFDAAHFYASEDPAPYSADEHRAAIATAAKELNDMRERWLNPPEWTREEFLDFPATAAGPWTRFIDPATVRKGVGTARYPRVVPRDEKCGAELAKRTLTALYNERPAWLKFAHEKLDAAVAAAYGWPAGLTTDAILKNLLILNQQRALAEEKSRLAAALAASGKPKKPQRAKTADELI